MRPNNRPTGISPDYTGAPTPTNIHMITSHHFLTLLFVLFLFASPHGRAQDGPWAHRVYRATSSDGIHWMRDTTLLFNPASVPGAVKDTQGRIFIYYVHTTSPTDTETVMVAGSSDGRHFSTPQPIQVSSSHVLRKVDPAPVLLPDGRIRLFYLDFGTRPTKNIYSAVSSDGIHFTEEAGIRFSKDGITDPDVFRVDSTWVMFLSLPQSGMAMVRAVSSDGLNFTEDTSFHWTLGGVSSTFRFPGPVYRTYFCGPGGIRSATSTDGLHLTSEAGIRIAPFPNEVVCDPTVVQLNAGAYIMYFKSAMRTTGIDDVCRDATPPARIFPNPSQNETIIAVEGAHQPPYHLRLYDAAGQLVYELNRITTRRVRIPGGTLPAGRYLYELRGEKGFSARGQLVIE